ncbi:hypothetical protein FA048_19215 [Pedobacter polaris]|uniref:Uncharacterized protein n=1 Tax=Pedobacter polaris TaxID=2571273 RepID=A0A4U1CDZ0_9SPHI|nr:hypothetical protein [Pedobacter polaris]TKC04594.1 hypothetical protein FA048_19215 [Pedobacter polaris]
MRKVFAIISSIITIFAIKEGYHIFTSSDKDIISQRPILIVIALSIIIPLIVLSLWLWKPKNNNPEES